MDHRWNERYKILKCFMHESLFCTLEQNWSICAVEPPSRNSLPLLPLSLGRWSSLTFVQKQIQIARSGWICFNSWSDIDYSNEQRNTQMVGAICQRLKLLIQRKMRNTISSSILRTFPLYALCIWLSTRLHKTYPFPFDLHGHWWKIVVNFWWLPLDILAMQRHG